METRLRTRLEPCRSWWVAYSFPSKPSSSLCGTVAGVTWSVTWSVFTVEVVRWSWCVVVVVEVVVVAMIIK